ncbi:MAG: hypothetical protein JST30_02530 [Armatimonadetes bacterium]|nr:hypothetical protein [Armatimonadota bacterium]
MPELSEVWSEVLPDLRKAVTGVGVWAALNAARPIVIEDGHLVLGLPHSENELAGHLRMAQTRRLIETEVGRHFDAPLTLRIIEGTSAEDWTTEKIRDAEKRKLNEQALARAKAELKAGVSWDGVYEKLSRKYAETPNRSLPQNRAKFFLEAVDIIVEALLSTPITDDLAERSYARCIERVAQYSEIPSSLVAVKILERSFSG